MIICTVDRKTSSSKMLIIEKRIVKRSYVGTTTALFKPVVHCAINEDVYAAKLLTWEHYKSCDFE